jgi:(heptosyl)LPS beta-1,4-glucosyltransferase
MMSRPVTSLTAIVIARNEASHIEDCLRTLDFADERLVLDGGSDDDTVARAKRLGARVLEQPDWQGFGIQRQRAQAQARGDWLLMVDADERVSPMLGREIRAAVDDTDPETSPQVYEIPRLTSVFGRFIRHGGWYPDWVARLYAREAGHYDSARVHEKLVPVPGVRVARLEQPLLHYSYTSVDQYLVKSARYAQEWAIEKDRQGMQPTLAQGLWHAVGCGLRMYVLRAGFLDGTEGWLLALLSAHSTFVKYASLWVRQRNPRDQAIGSG